MPLPVTPSQVDHDVSEPNIAVGVRITSCTPQDGAMEIEKLRARLDEANGQLIAGVVESLIRETEVVAANAEMLLEAGTQVLQAQRAAEVAEAEFLKARAEATELAAKRLAGGEVPLPGSLLQQFKLKQDRAKAEKEAKRTAESLAATTHRLADLKASRALLPARTPPVPNHVSPPTPPNAPLVCTGAKGGKDADASGHVGTTLANKGKALHTKMKTAKGAAAAFRTSALGEGVALAWPENENERRREVRSPLVSPPPHTRVPAHRNIPSPPHTPHAPAHPQVLDHMEAVLFGAGRGNYDRSYLLMASLLERPAISVPHPPLPTPCTCTCTIAQAAVRHHHTSTLCTPSPDSLATPHQPTPLLGEPPAPTSVRPVCLWKHDRG